METLSNTDEQLDVADATDIGKLAVVNSYKFNNNYLSIMSCRHSLKNKINALITIQQKEMQTIQDTLNSR